MTTPQRAEKTFYALSTDLLRVFHSQLERELGRSATPDDTRPLRALLGQARWSRHDHEKTRLATDLITGLLARETPLDVGQLQADLQRLELIDATWSRLSPSDEQARQIPDSEQYCYDHRQSRAGPGDQVMVSGKLETLRSVRQSCAFWSVQNTPGRNFGDGRCDLLNIRDSDLDAQHGGALHSTGLLLWDQVRRCPPIRPDSE